LEDFDHALQKVLSFLLNLSFLKNVRICNQWESVRNGEEKMKKQ
jgi:hypothetical protein